MAQTTRTRSRRRWLSLLLIALIGGAGWGVYMLTHPVLTPVTKRVVPKDTNFIFSANRTGYPAVECYESSRTVLDDRCRPVATPPHPEGPGLVSPTRRVIAGGRYLPSILGSSYDQYEVAPLWRNGRPVTTGESIEVPLTGMLCITDDGAVCRQPRFLHLPTGRKIELPTGTWLGLPAVIEPGMVATLDWNGRGTDVVLFDIRARKPKKVARLTLSPAASSLVPFSMLFRDGQRILIVPGDGPPAIYQGEKRIGTYTGWQWMWGEDGTVWGVNAKGAVSLLRWRDAIPRLEKLPVLVKLDSAMCDMAPNRIASYTAVPVIPLPPALPAAWGDGRLLAVTETRPTMPARAVPAADTVAGWFKQPPVPRQVRMLTLYRDGKQVGAYATHLQPLAKTIPRIAMLASMAMRMDKYREHLAFTKDGKYLSWIINTGGQTEVYAFATGI